MNDAMPASDEFLRQAFKRFNPFMITLFRLGLGSYGNRTRWGGYVMVLTHTGRKSGRPRRTPVNYAEVDGDIYCVAAFGKGADWFRNIQANPAVEVWLPDGWWAGLAEDASDHPDALALKRRVLVCSGFAAYAAGLDPMKMSDEELERVSAEYRLVRIRRSEARTGPGGPGDLAWVWPAATAALLLIALRPRRRK